MALLNEVKAGRAERTKGVDGSSGIPGNYKWMALFISTLGMLMATIDGLGSARAVEHDSGEMGPMVEQIQERYDQVPERMLVDGGFANLEDIAQTQENHGTQTYMPIKNEKQKLEKGEDPYAPLPRDPEPVKQWRQRMGTAEAKLIYRRRAQTAEWVNAGIRQRGLYQVLVRGVQKVKTMGLWHALAHNLLRAAVLRQSAAA